MEWKSFATLKGDTPGIIPVKLSENLPSGLDVVFKILLTDKDGRLNYGHPMITKINFSNCIPFKSIKKLS